MEADKNPPLHIHHAKLLFQYVLPVFQEHCRQGKYDVSLKSQMHTSDDPANRGFH